LVIKMVAAYCSRFYIAKPVLAARRIEAIGFQVVQQLSERYDWSSYGFPDPSLGPVRALTWETVSSDIASRELRGGSR
jgi:hypothetical protein